MILARPKLIENVLKSIAAHSLTAVVAPLGYGKSTLARAALEKLPASCYYAVPVGPHDGHFVWHDMCASFEAQGLGVAAELKRLGLPESAAQAREALGLLRGTGAETRTLIIDDYHYVTDPQMDSFWERAAREALPNLRLLLLSRGKPGVNLEDLWLKGLAELFEQAPLAFSARETEDFFRLNGIEDPVAVAETQKYSEGWPAVVWLCLKSWQRGGRIVPGEDIESLLANAVFAAYSPDEQDFLLRLSVFDSFVREDAEKIARGAGWLPVSLLELRQKNTFLTMDANTEIYQFHSIFRDFLRKRLAVTAHIDKPALYRLAGECCFARKHHVSALRLFRRAGRDEDLFRLLDCFRYFAEDRKFFFFAEECFETANSLPWRVRLSNPLGWMTFVGLYALMWKDQRTASLLNETAEHFRAAILSEGLRNRISGEIELVRAYMAFNKPDTMFRHYSEAVRLLDGPSAFISEDFPWNCGSPSLSFAVLREPGSYEALPGQAAELLSLYNILSGGKAKDYENIIFAEHLLERGDFSGAEPVFTNMLARCAGDERQLMGTLLASFGLARLFAALGNPKKAVSMRRNLENSKVPYLFDSLEVATGYVAAVLGRPASVPRWLRDGEMLDPPHNVMPHIFGISLTVHAKVLVLEGDWQGLMRVAKKIPDAAPLRYLFARLHGKILEALAGWHTLGQNQALDLLSEALELSRPDGIILPAAEYGGHILPLLRRLKRVNPKDEHLEAILSLAGRIARVAPLSGKAQKGLLTPREWEVMRHVALGKTNPAIAEELSISINTVKYMIGNASAKLGAYGRLGAAQRFIELYGSKNPA